MRTSVIPIMLSILSACAGAPSLLRVDPLAPGGECPAGGVTVQTGVDDNDNGELDAAEVDSSQAICDGEDGAASLVRLVDEPAGGNCPYGGTEIQTGVDDDRDGQLDASEIDDVAYTCAARATLTIVTPEGPGSNCAGGGTRLESGVDADGDGVLDPQEVGTTSWVCSGLDAEQVAVRTVPLAPGTPCANGGLTIEWGVDDNRDGTLDDSEVDQGQALCDGGDGTSPLVAVSPEPAGAHCFAGGSRVDTGVDADRDGVLGSSEVATSAYVCNGAASALARYRLRLSESPTVATRQFGRTASTDGRTLAISTQAPVAGQIPVFVYDRPDASTPWQLRTTLTLPAIGNAGDRVVVDGDVLAVTAYNDPTEGAGHGAVFVFERVGGTWTSTATLLSGEPPTLGFGIAVAVRAGTVVVASGGLDAKLFVFRKDAAGVWQRVQVVPLPGAPYAGVGALAMTEDTIVAGGTSGSGLAARGAALIYRRVPATGAWLFEQELLPRTCCGPTTLTTQYGSAVAIDGRRVAVADPGGGAFGRVLVFESVEGAGWQERGALTPADATTVLRVGGAVALTGDRVALTMLDDELGDQAYAVRLFSLAPEGGWIERQRLLSPDRVLNDNFAATLSAAGDTLVVCAPAFGTALAPNFGVCHDYQLSPSL
jgi:hypothetical protein